MPPACKVQECKRPAPLAASRSRSFVASQPRGLATSQPSLPAWAASRTARSLAAVAAGADGGSRPARPEYDQAMFTGLIDHSGTVAKVERHEQGAQIEIETALASQLQLGDSVAVNGACMTAAALTPTGFSADVMNESLSRTNLGGLAVGSRVNLELPLAVGDKLDGHIVQGHVDGLGRIAEVREDGFARVLRVKLPEDLARYVVEKGSIAIDGVSLTVSAVGDDFAEVSLIPETQERTTLGGLQVGSAVNLEVDILAKHVERLLTHPPE